MINCPICGPTDAKSWRQCPKHEGQAVCSNCCRKCRHFNLENFRCNWHIENPRVNTADEIKKLELQIAALDQQAEYYYNKSLPKKAEKAEFKALILREKKRELENENI